MQNFNNSLALLKIKQKETNLIFKPQFYRLINEKDREKFISLLNSPQIILTDEIIGQIVELIKINNPGKKFSTDELDLLTKKHFGDIDADTYGVWIYYPWSHRLVHSVDETEFITLRTSRNKYKITDQERDLLYTKKVGVIGLSVGQSVSVTMAMERGCGELRLADFDTLELTNLNRIRTGIHNLGLAKVYSVAREIAEIDPFLNVVCFEKGLTEDNMHDFFMANGKLDLLVEESDGFDIKILSRYMARELGVPVIMEGSDRCEVDVERFDLEPTRSILHGLVDHLEISKLKDLKTTEQKIPYLLDILGIESASLRLKASMLEIDQTINTWPQLASSVTMGGGIMADVARRILLNLYTESGRYHVDIEELIGNKVLPAHEHDKAIKTTETDFKKLSRAASISKDGEQENLSKLDVEKLVMAGCLAPSGGNAQPWRWSYINGALLLFKAFNDHDVFLGFDNLSSYVAIGAAIENVELLAGEMGLACRYELFPEAGVNDLTVIFRFFKDGSVKNQKQRATAINVRLTNRMLGERMIIEKSILEKLVQAANEIEGATLHFLTSDGELDAIGDLLGELEKIRLLEKTGHKNFVDEIRWTEEENEEKRDGVDIRTLDISNTELAGLKMSKDGKVIELINKWAGGGAFKKLTKKSIDAAGAVGIIQMRGSAHSDYVNAGRALQKIWLEATVNGIAFQPMAAPVFMYARLLRGNGEGISKQGIGKLQNLRGRYEKELLIAHGSTEIFIFRLSKAKEPIVKSLRKPLEEIFSYF